MMEVFNQINVSLSFMDKITDKMRIVSYGCEPTSSSNSYKTMVHLL